MHRNSLLTVLFSAGTALATQPPVRPAVAASRSACVIKCPIIFDGRVPNGTAMTYFDTSNSLFNPDYVKGANLKWSQILQVPSVTASRFDAGGYEPLEVTISDASIFNNQTGFRRAGLQFSSDSPTGPGNSGMKTIHWSVKQDPAKPMNLSHEYLNVWHETSDYSADQFMFEAGTIIGSSGSVKDNWKILNRNSQSIWSTPIDSTQWQNFAVTMDYNKNTLQVYYSAGTAALTAVTSAVSNDNSGNGQFQMGILKKPTGTSDVVNSGYQEGGMHEGQIYGGLFVEDSANGCIST
ncbi:glycoside hydrolase family 131 protein [Cenococcum geophilum 1.58]|uniref:glycoside hydrolase family 131 protein n=1 Tax=Cenococcum geophilum 1.58 TaxID=794803 RepID=UPI00358E5181|nr:glycoside hydrolase family 131 protein [Cenococcum geophilum 1.58]